MIDSFSIVWMDFPVWIRWSTWYFRTVIARFTNWNFIFIVVAIICLPFVFVNLIRGSSTVIRYHLTWQQKYQVMKMKTSPMTMVLFDRCRVNQHFIRKLEDCFSQHRTWDNSMIAWFQKLVEPSHFWRCVFLRSHVLTIAFERQKRTILRWISIMLGTTDPNGVNGALNSKIRDGSRERQSCVLKYWEWVWESKENEPARRVIDKGAWLGETSHQAAVEMLSNHESLKRASSLVGSQSSSNRNTNQTNDWRRCNAWMDL